MAALTSFWNRLRDGFTLEWGLAARPGPGGGLRRAWEARREAERRGGVVSLPRPG